MRRSRAVARDPAGGGGALTFLGGCKELEQVGLFFIMGGLEKSRAHFSVLGGDFGGKNQKVTRRKMQRTSGDDQRKERPATTNAKSARKKISPLRDDPTEFF